MVMEIRLAWRLNTDQISKNKKKILLKMSQYWLDLLSLDTTAGKTQRVSGNLRKENENSNDERILKLFKAFVFFACGAPTGIPHVSTFPWFLLLVIIGFFAKWLQEVFLSFLFCDAEFPYFRIERLQWVAIFDLDFFFYFMSFFLFAGLLDSFCLLDR